MLNEMMQFNQKFVEDKGYEQYLTSKYPDKKVAILTCMDARLTELLPAALGIKNGDAKMIKNAGGVVSHPFGSVMRSLLIAVYELGVKEVLVIGHTDCGASHTSSVKLQEKMKEHGITDKEIDLIKYCGVELDAWLSGFEHLETSVMKSVEIIRQHPLMPDDIAVSGLVINSETGKLTNIEE